MATNTLPRRKPWVLPTGLISITSLILILILLITGTQVKTQPPVDNGKKIAVVDDSPNFADSLIFMLGTIISGVKFQYYVNCGLLLDVISAGTRYDLYLVDYVPAVGQLSGTFCTEAIVSVDKFAKVVGMSSVKTEADRRMISNFYI